MSLQLAIHHGTRTVIATGSGILHVEDIQGYFYGLTPATLSSESCSISVTARST